MTAEQIVFSLLIIGLILLIFLLLSYLINRLIEESSSGSSGDSSGDSEEKRQAEAEKAERRLARAATGVSDPEEAKKQMILQILQSDEGFLKNQMMRQAGLDHKDLQNMAHQEELVKRIARELDLKEIITLSIAASTKDVRVTAESGEKSTPVNYPSNDLEIEPLRDLDQIGQVSPEDLLDPNFMYRLATQDLSITQYYETSYEQALYYMLHDVSGSMEEQGSAGIPRYITARGIACKLLSLAIDGKATYIHRFFDGNVHPKRMATTPEESQDVFDVVAKSGYSGAGTDILTAIRIAVRDIRQETGLVKAEILLISDGDDSAVNSAEELRLILGEIKLHVILLGGDNPVLQAVATTYKKY